MRHTSRYFLLLLCLFLAPMAKAQTSLLIATHIQSARIDLAYPADEVRKTEFNSLILRWEEPLSPWLDGQIDIGVLDVTQSSNPITEGQSTEGQTLALGLRFHLYESRALKLNTDLGYQYARTRNSQSGLGVELRWQQVDAAFVANIHLFRYSYLVLTAGAVAIDGKEIDSGATLEFDANQHFFGSAGVLLGLDQNGHIGIEVSSGTIRGGRIYFQRWF